MHIYVFNGTSIENRRERIYSNISIQPVYIPCHQAWCTDVRTTNIHVFTHIRLFFYEVSKIESNRINKTWTAPIIHEDIDICLLHLINIVINSLIYSNIFRYLELLGLAKITRRSRNTLRPVLKQQGCMSFVGGQTPPGDTSFLNHMEWKATWHHSGRSTLCNTSGNYSASKSYVI